MDALQTYPNIHAKLGTMELVNGIAVLVALATISGDPSPISRCFTPYYTVSVQGDEWLVCDRDLSNPTEIYGQIESLSGCKLMKRRGETLDELVFGVDEAQLFLRGLEASLSSSL